jgi:hypothetical protein
MAYIMEVDSALRDVGFVKHSIIANPEFAFTPAAKPLM